MKENGLYGAHNTWCMEQTPNCLCHRCVHDDLICCVERDRMCDDDCKDFEPEQELIVNASPTWEELQRERDANIQGLPKKSKDWVQPVREEKCKGCLDLKFNLCLRCVNFPICDLPKCVKPNCWVGDMCANCEGGRLK